MDERETRAGLRASLVQLKNKILFSFTRLIQCEAFVIGNTKVKLQKVGRDQIRWISIISQERRKEKDNKKGKMKQRETERKRGKKKEGETEKQRHKVRGRNS